MSHSSSPDPVDQGAERYARLRELFLAARDLSGAERTAHLDRACGDDAELRAELERLLGHDDDAEDFLARPALEGGVPITQASEHGSDSSRLSDEEYPPGRILVGRYRIVTRLGAGGMGEVFLADDLTLEEQVALKFLPRFTGSLPRLRHEVQLARRVSHPNVGRVHDIGEVDERYFLTMEYVDGEDLRSLLKQLGRLPREKALEIARQICEGLAAAHAHGVLHRDLKPANVMLDREGKVRLMDFGVASLTGEGEAPDEVAGTPAYMSPEQVAGDTVTVQSEVYSLGLLLHELFTGRRAVRGRTFLDVVREHASGVVPSREALADVDPSVADAIERCLATEPEGRPASVDELGRELPGGDPIEAALAAGETPSPGVIAGAGARGRLEPKVAAALVALALLGTWLSLVVWERTQPAALAPLAKPPEVLLDRARELLVALGVDAESRAFEYHGFVFDAAGARAQRAAAPDVNPREGWRADYPAPVRFWIRASPVPLVPAGLGVHAVLEGNPAGLTPGEARVAFDPRGLLLALAIAPPGARGPEVAPVAPVAQVDRGDRGDPVNWTPLFGAAGLEQAAFEPAATDGRSGAEAFAWTGPGPAGAASSDALRVEGEVLGGAPVAFRVLSTPPEERRTNGASAFATCVKIALIGVGLSLAHRNLRSGRVDRDGANRLAAVVFGLSFLSWLLGADHDAVSTEYASFQAGAANALLRATLVWVFYVAVENAVRRLWPRILTGWMRLLKGGFRDPRVARDVLIGTVFGSFLAVVFLGYELAPTSLVGVSPLPDELVARMQLASLSGVRVTASYLTYAVEHVLVASLMAVVLLVALRLLLRKEVLCVAVFLLLLTFAFDFHTGDDRLFNALGSGLIVFVLIRFGLVALTASLCVQFLLVAFPRELSGWAADAGWLVLAVWVGVLAYGVVGSVRGEERPAPVRSPASAAR